MGPHIIMVSSAPITSMQHEVRSEDINHIFHHNVWRRNMMFYIASLFVLDHPSINLSLLMITVVTMGGLNNLNV